MDLRAQKCTFRIVAAIFSAAVFAAAFFCDGRPAIAQTGAAEQPDKQVVVLFDQSGSVGWLDPQLMSKAWLLTFLRTFETPHRIVLAGFDEEVREFPEVSSSNPSDMSELSRRVDAISTRGLVTDFEVAFRYLLDRTDYASVRYVILVSDGKPDIWDGRLGYLSRAVKSDPRYADLAREFDALATQGQSAEQIFAHLSARFHQRNTELVEAHLPLLGAALENKIIIWDISGRSEFLKKWAQMAGAHYFPASAGVGESPVEPLREALLALQSKTAEMVDEPLPANHREEVEAVLSDVIKETPPAQSVPATTPDASAAPETPEVDEPPAPPPPPPPEVPEPPEPVEPTREDAGTMATAQIPAAQAAPEVPEALSAVEISEAPAAPEMADAPAAREVAEAPAAPTVPAPDAAPETREPSGPEPTLYVLLGILIGAAIVAVVLMMRRVRARTRQRLMGTDSIEEGQELIDEGVRKALREAERLRRQQVSEAFARPEGDRRVSLRIPVEPETVEVYWSRLGGWIGKGQGINLSMHGILFEAEGYTGEPIDRIVVPRKHAAFELKRVDIMHREGNRWVAVVQEFEDDVNARMAWIELLTRVNDEQVEP